MRPRVVRLGPGRKAQSDLLFRTAGSEPAGVPPMFSYAKEVILV